MSMFFMSCCDEQATRTPILKNIAREQAMTEICLYCKGASVRPIAREQARTKDDCKGMTMKGLPCNNQIFICCRLQGQQHWEYFLCCIAKEATTIMFLMLREAVYCQGACNGNKPTIARQEDATINFFMLSIAMIMKMSLYCKKQQWG